MGSSLDDLKDMPDEVIDEFGYALDRVQSRQSHPGIKPLTGLRGVQEIRVDHEHSTYRTVYIATLPDGVYVLHAFQKKSKSGIATPRKDIELVRQRLARAQQLSAERLEQETVRQPKRRSQ